MAESRAKVEAYATADSAAAGKCVAECPLAGKA